MEENELIVKAQSGDRTAYNELMLLHHRTVEKFAYQCGVQIHDIPDVTQEVFIKLYRFLHQFQRERFTTWLYKITLNTARDYYRKEIKEKDKESKILNEKIDRSNIHSAETKVLLFEEDRKLHEAIQQLDEKYRLPIVLYYFQELTYEQISEVLNVPLSTVKIRLLRAKNQLKNSLSNEEGGANFGR